MIVDPNKIKQVPLSNKEITLLIQIINHCVPSQEDQGAIVQLVEKLDFLLRLN